VESSKAWEPASAFVRAFKPAGASKAQGRLSVFARFGGRNPRPPRRIFDLRFGLCCVLLTATGCRQDMHDQAKYKPLAKSEFFADGRSARPVVAGSVARGQLRLDDQLYTGRMNGQYATTYPFPIDRTVLQRGQERFNIFCAPCHDQLGYGQGMIVQRGFRPPPSFHDQRLRDAAPGLVFDVITNGFGTMWSYAERVSPEDRWAIAAYIRVLQLSQNARIADVPESDRNKIEEALRNKPAELKELKGS
jgi:mono/diheme cytochrome c family protein